MRKALITGGAGFIGSTLADRLSAEGIEVVIYDNLSRGRREFIAERMRPARAWSSCRVTCSTKSDSGARSRDATPFSISRRTRTCVTGSTSRGGISSRTRSRPPSCSRRCEPWAFDRIAFASTGSVYGEPEVFPTPETCPFPVQTSLYGASKLAGEGLIQAYAHGYGFVGVIFRFVSILGERYTHGHVFDFCRSLRKDPSRLRVLGDGRQEKSYLYVGDCVSAMKLATEQPLEAGAVTIYNLGTDETIVVDDSIATITAHLGVTPELEYTGGIRGWLGDSPLIHLDCERIRSLGWRPTLSIRDAIRRTVDWLEQNPTFLDERAAA